MFYGAHFSFKIHFVQRTSHDLSPGAGGEDFGRDHMVIRQNGEGIGRRH